MIGKIANQKGGILGGNLGGKKVEWYNGTGGFKLRPRFDNMAMEQPAEEMPMETKMTMKKRKRK